MKIGTSIYKIITKQKLPPNVLKMAFNNLSSEVRKNIQINLLREGFYKSSIDGSYGRGTEKALKSFNSNVLDGADLRRKSNVTRLLSQLGTIQTPKEEKNEEKVEKNVQTELSKENVQTISDEWESLAEEGSAKAQYKLSLMYEKGEGFLQDYVYAHMWANLSATNGYSDARILRDSLAKKMTASQMEKAQDLARDCMKKKYKGC
jgi:hypothetical protein